MGDSGTGNVHTNGGNPNCKCSSADRLQGLVLADSIAVINFQFPENEGGQDCQSSQGEERLVDAVNHLRRAGVKAVGNEKRGGQ